MIMENEIAALKSFLAEFFRDQHYQNGIKNAKFALNNGGPYSTIWDSIVRCIVSKELPEGIPIDLIHHSANLPLDENTDDEAYKWLLLMLINIGSCPNEKVIEY